MSYKPKKRGTPPQPKKPIKSSLFRRAWQALLALATLIGIPAFVLTVVPRVSVSSPSAPLDANNVLSVSFDISNTGYVPLNDVSAKLAAGHISAPNGGGLIESRLKPNGVPYFDVYFPILPGQHHHLGIDERFTINPESQLGGYIDKADIAIVVSYQPWIIPITSEKRFRFLAVKDGQGRTYWRSWPIDEPAPTR
jgi:hypothetical protein